MKIKPENTLFQAHIGGIYSTLFSTGTSGRAMETFPRRNTPQPDAEKRVKAYVFLVSGVSFRRGGGGGGAFFPGEHP